MTEKRDSAGLLAHIRGPEDFATAFGVSRETVQRLEIYATQLALWQRKINLVGPKTLDDIWHRHFADSAQLTALAPRATSWVDVGSGAGFPGLVIAILSAERGHGRIALIESDARKAAFLAEVVRQTGIARLIAVDILNQRCELPATQDKLRGADVVSARAVADLSRLLTLTAPLFAPETVGLFPKGRDAESELRDASESWHFESELVPSRTDADGRIIVIRQPRAKTED